MIDETTTTAAMRRTTDDLVRWLVRELDIPDGAVLATGTGIVPPLGQSLEPGDVVEIAIAGIGRLRNRVATDARSD